MPKRIKILYACTDIPAISFMIAIDPKTTCEELLTIINERRNKEYTSIFFKHLKICNSDIITNYLKIDADSIFYLSTTDNLPASEFIQSIINSKGIITEEDHSEEHNSTNIPKYSPTNAITSNLQEDIENSNITYDGIKEEFIFYFTGSTINHLSEGITVELYLSMTSHQCHQELLRILHDKGVSINDKQLLIYLPGGIPFNSGTISDIYMNKKFSVKKIIYGVLSRFISDSELDKEILNVCNISDNYHRLLMPPLCESSERGLSDVACLVGYLNHDGINSELFQRKTATIIPFAPFIISMNKIIKRSKITGRDIVTFCSTLFTFLRANLSCEDNQLFENLLRICNLIMMVENEPEKLPIVRIDNIYGQTTNIEFWKADLIGEIFEHQKLDLTKSFDDENIFSPISPLSIRYSSTCKIVKGKTHEYLYLMDTLFKSYQYRNKVEIIDPTVGYIELKDAEIFAKEQENGDEHLIEPNEVKQIIMVNLDESQSMRGDISGCFVKSDFTEIRRITIAIQYLTIFINRIYGYRFPSIQGLVSFNKTITVRCPLSPFISDFEEKGLKKIQPRFMGRLWDSLIRSCDEIVKFRKDKEGREIYKNAISRILVISDGDEDNISKAKVEDVVKDLIRNKIIVDSVILNDQDEGNMLCAVCHATGGFSFKIKNIEDGLKLFQNSAFLNFDERGFHKIALIPRDASSLSNRLTINKITEDFMKSAEFNASFDSDIYSNEIKFLPYDMRFETPQHICNTIKENAIPDSRSKRILKELFIAKKYVDPENNDFYDPELQIFTLLNKIDKWIVFLKSPKDSLYGEKWWKLLVTFPDLYPNEKPNFRFIIIPYHINVSHDGKICHNILEKGYTSAKHVVEIIQELKELFIIESLSTPVLFEAYILLKENRHDIYEQLAKKSAQEM